VSIARSIFNDDHNIFRDSFRSFLEKEVLPQQELWLKEGIVSRDIWKRCGELGFLVPAAPEKYGGTGLNDFRFDAIVIEELSRIAESGLMLGLHSSLVAPYIISYCNEEQKQRIIPKIVSGETILAVAMSEPDAGSDLSAMKATAENKGDYWLLNGQKTFISNGLLADLIVVAARTDPQNPHGMGLFMVERDDPGFERGRRLSKIGMQSQDTAELFFKDVKVKKENVLGNPLMGFQYLMEKLAVERLVLCVGSVATAQSAVEKTVKYVQERKAFGKPISKFQNTQFKLAECKTEADVGQIYVDRLIMAENENKLSATDACAAKLWTTDMACRVTDECMQLHGGWGYMTEYPISRMFTDARVGKIYAGTNEIMKTVIAKGMGL